MYIYNEMPEQTTFQWVYDKSWSRLYNDYEILDIEVSFSFNDAYLRVKSQLIWLPIVIEIFKFVETEVLFRDNFKYHTPLQTVDCLVDLKTVLISQYGDVTRIPGWTTQNALCLAELRIIKPLDELQLLERLLDFKITLQKKK